MRSALDGIVATRPNKQIRALAKKGRRGDTEMVHATPGETVLSVPFQQRHPALMAATRAAMLADGIDPRERIVADTAPRNPATGAEAFADPVRQGPRVDDVPRWFSSAPGKRADLTYTTKGERDLLRTLGLGHSQMGSGEPVADGTRQHMGPKGIPSYNGEGGSMGGNAAEQAGTQDSSDYGGRTDPSPGGYGGEDDDDASNAGAIAGEERSLPEKSVHEFTLAHALDVAQEKGLAFVEDARAAGISVDTPDMDGFFGGAAALDDDPMNDPGGDHEEDPQIWEPRDGKPVDPGNDDQAQATDPVRRLTVARAAYDAPMIERIRAVYALAGASAISGFLATPRINPQTGAQMFAREDNFDRDWYLQQYSDVANAGVDPWEHYQSHGRNEGRTGNEREQRARDEGYSGAFGSGGYQQWKTDQLQQFRDGSGNIRPDLLGGSVTDAFEPGSLPKLEDRREARDEEGYEGQWGAGGYNRFRQAYSDHDNNPLTRFTAGTGANVDRQGNDRSNVRNIVRGTGFGGRWGAGGAARHVRSGLEGYGITPTGNMEQDALTLRAAQMRPQPTDWGSRLPAWMRGYVGTRSGGSAGGAPVAQRRPQSNQPVSSAIEVFSALTPDRRRRFVDTRNRRYSPAFAA